MTRSGGFKLLIAFNVVTGLEYLALCFLTGTEVTGNRVLEISLGYVLHHAVVGCLFAAVFVSREFSDRTFGLSLLCGRPRRTVFLAKALVFLGGFLMLYILYAGVAALSLLVYHGYGMSLSDSLLRVGCGIAGCLAMGAVMLLVAVIAKKTVATVVTGVGLTYLLLWLETTFREHPLPFIKYTYSYQIGQIEYLPKGEFAPGLFLAVMAFTLLVAVAAALLVFEKRELR